jgi:hypothetical protein
VLGDLNAYAAEDPIRSMTANGYSSLVSASSYSFLFMNEWGSLDHALSTSALAGQVTGAAKWYINSDEPRSLDYNTEFKTAAQITSLFAPDQYRSADHDPLVVGFNLIGPSGPIVTVKAGSWNDPTVWNVGRLPLAGESVQVLHAVTIPAGTFPVGRIVFGAVGRLFYATGGQLAIGN